MSVMTESRNVSWQPIADVEFGRTPKQCSFPGCRHKPTCAKITSTTITRKFAYCPEHLYV